MSKRNWYPINLEEAVYKELPKLITLKKICPNRIRYSYNEAIKYLMNFYKEGKK